MSLSDQSKRYLSIGGVVAIALVIFYLASREKPFSCDDWANNFKNNFQCNIVLTKKDKDGGVATLTGIDIKSNKPIEAEDGSKWIIENFEKFNIGDTVLKEKGKFTIFIKRKTSKIVIQLKCDNKIYTD